MMPTCFGIGTDDTGARLVGVLLAVAGFLLFASIVER